MENIAIYKTYENQSWLDISIVIYGNPAFAFDLAKWNQSTITQEVATGVQIVYDKNIQQNKLVLLSLNSNRRLPSTGLNSELMDSPLEGIDYWTIETDFVIN